VLGFNITNLVRDLAWRSRNVGVDLHQEAEELMVAMSGLAVRKDLAAGDAQGADLPVLLGHRCGDGLRMHIKHCKTPYL